MKLRGILGTASGKLGNGVASTVAGQTIMRQYQPNVKNPNTDAQVAQRARLKLASQLAAAMSPVIVIPKQGLQSSRNLFIKRNMPNIDATQSGAECQYESLQITGGNRFLANIVATRGQNDEISVHLSDDVTGIADRVVYCLFRIDEKDQLSYLRSTIVEEGGTGGTFPGSIEGVNTNVIVYAYGIKDATSNASAKYENYTVDTADHLAYLVANGSLKVSDYNFTATIGTSVGME